MTDKGVGEAAADVVVVRVDAHVGDRGSGFGVIMMIVVIRVVWVGIWG